MSQISNVLDKLYKIMKIKNDAEFCSKYCIKQNTLSTWRARNTIPYDLILKISKEKNISLDEIFLDKKNKNTSQNEKKDGYWIQKIPHKTSMNINTNVGIINNMIFIPSIFFKTLNNPDKLRLIQVEGYSMTPDLLPDSYVIYEEGIEFIADGLYVVNFDGLLMVKIIQKKPTGELLIKSSNSAYESFILDKNSELSCCIIGKVLRCII